MHRTIQGIIQRECWKFYFFKLFKTTRLQELSCIVALWIQQDFYRDINLFCTNEYINIIRFLMINKQKFCKIRLI